MVISEQSQLFLQVNYLCVFRIYLQMFDVLVRVKVDSLNFKIRAASLIELGPQRYKVRIRSFFDLLRPLP